jgi:hypothetical protein
MAWKFWGTIVVCTGKILEKGASSLGAILNEGVLLDRFEASGISGGANSGVAAKFREYKEALSYEAAFRVLSQRDDLDHLAQGACQTHCFPDGRLAA